MSSPDTSHVPAAMSTRTAAFSHVCSAKLKAIVPRGQCTVMCGGHWCVCAHSDRSCVKSTTRCRVVATTMAVLPMRSATKAEWRSAVAVSTASNAVDTSCITKGASTHSCAESTMSTHTAWNGVERGRKRSGSGSGPASTRRATKKSTSTASGTAQMSTAATKTSRVPSAPAHSAPLAGTRRKQNIPVYPSKWLHSFTGSLSLMAAGSVVFAKTSAGADCVPSRYVDSSTEKDQSNSERSTMAKSFGSSAYRARSMIELTKPHA
mmetsp:Transcript_17254/g.53576  ORF Transcript_17254/g.53576 Transcript_17254/m.53576 type:complete len:264 (-) Transcript_17254:796-1587(-)